MQKNKFSKNFIASILISSAAFALSAQAHNSTQAHQSPVTNVAFLDGNSEKSVVSAGEDGFLIKWTEDGIGAHYQISDLPIKMITRSPNGNDIAVYESDGASLNRVSVWNWKTLTRRYAYRFTDSITTLKYSAKGSYLICGTASVNGTSFINSTTGNFDRTKIKENTGVVNYIATSDTENSAIAYSPKGLISYYNIRKGQLKAKYPTEDYLSQVGLFNNNVFLAGVRDKTIFVVQAVTGTTIGKFPANDPILVASNKCPDLLYIVNEGREFKVYKIQNDRNKAVVAPELLRTFSGLKNNERIVCADFAGEEIYAGTNLGNIYKFDYSAAERVDVQQSLSDDMYEKVYDVAAVGDGFYFLSSKTLFKSSYDNGVIERKAANSGYTNVITYNDNAILWEKDSKRNVVMLDSAGALNQLYSPSAALQVLRLSGDSLIAIESHSNVIQIDIATGNKKELYTGTGIQDAILVSEKNLYVAKSSASTPNVPLLYVNTETQETVPLNLKGNIAYSLNYDSAKPNEFYGVTIYTDSTSKRLTTAIFSFDMNRKTYRNMLSISDEDSEAFTNFSFPVLYTNIGKTQVRSYNLNSRRDFLYKRSASMPVKVAKNGNRMLVLNRDGSVSWYNADMNAVIADWYLTNDETWFEF
ncbi:MAG: hypothetical protein KBT11_01175 [Treponema sp.]|nr:hypothetical protein [Candidatus Treponema equifaecale]